MAQTEWPDFHQTRNDMLVMSLGELEALTGRKPPRLLPAGTPAVLAGIIIAFAAQQLWPVFMLGLAIAAYGLIALIVNRAAISEYRDGSYRAWVHAQADAMQDEDDEPAT